MTPGQVPPEYSLASSKGNIVQSNLGFDNGHPYLLVGASDGRFIDGDRLGVEIDPSGAPARIYAMQAQVLPKSKSPKSGPFRGGRGHVGVQFEQHPTVTPYSAPYDSVGVTARLIEVDE